MLLAVTFIRSVPASAQAAQQSAQQQADVRRARSLVLDCENHAGRMEYYLAQMEASGTQTGEKTIQDFNASATQLVDSFNKAKEIFARLPGDDETVADLLANAGLLLSLRCVISSGRHQSGAIWSEFCLERAPGHHR